MTKKNAGVAGRLRSWLGMIKLPRIRKDWLLAAACGLLVGIFAGRFVSLPTWIGGGGDVSFTQDELSRARRATRYAVSGLESFLGYGRNADGWRHYLRLHDLRYHLDPAAAPAPAADAEQLGQILDLFSGEHDGLDLPEFANVRTTLSTYLKMLKLADQPPVHVAAQPRMLR